MTLLNIAQSPININFTSPIASCLNLNDHSKAFALLILRESESATIREAYSLPRCFFTFQLSIFIFRRGSLITLGDDVAVPV